MKKFIILFFYHFFLLQIIYCQNLNDSLLLYYPFSGNSSDLSGNGFHATNYGQYGEDRFGNPNSALYLDGNTQYLDFPNIPELKPPLPVSFAMWVKPMSFSLVAQAYVFNTSFDQDTYTGVMLNLYPGQPIASLGYGGGIPGVTGPFNRRTKFGTTHFQLNTWYFIVCVVRGPQDMDIYIDCENDGGTYDGTGPSLAYGTGPGTVGRSDLVAFQTLYYHGYIDELRYWNRALTPQDISYLCGFYASAGEDSTICNGNSVIIGGNPSANGGVSPFIFSWSPVTGLNDPTIANPTASPSTTTTYILSITDSNSNISTDTVTVFVNPLPFVDLGSDIYMCENDTVILNAGSGFSSYLWSTSETTSSIEVTNGGVYSVTVANIYGCQSDDEIQIETTPKFDATITSTGPWCSDNAPMQLTSVYSFDSYWFGNGVTDSILGIYNPSLAGVGEHLITHIIQGSCGDTATAIIKIIDCSEPTLNLFIPNVFSPNGDGENDVLYVRGENIQYLEFIIYNRWGEKVFETNDQQIGWDGTFKGKLCDPAVFCYFVKAIFNDSHNIQISGNVTLVK